ncbi:hypothetical protein SAE02_59910 [Skermanella aerolata]|uniref:Transposase DDE domain-containing protein n=1 Tax=Skermanella aerolata TaxID=393310 RepID=A0A512DZC7_9PROT|nr:hypothetical protein [Skermanella aerolata]KJB91063.1 hypothetical protein N826_30390 [Skermanella aerolata KACC 11604]GEO41843.1 hypothetical protein SAE02_59910 [Skermanella aerolata]
MPVMAILLRCRAGFHLPTDQVADQNRKFPSPLCRQARPCHSARLHSVVHFDARMPSAPEPASIKARNMAETIIGHIKKFSSLNLSKHRSVINAFVHIIAAITTYQINGLG